MVRVTIETDTDVIGIQSPMLDTRYHGWWLKSIKGWDSPPAADYKPQRRPTADGSYMPTAGQLTTEGRTLELACWTVCESSIAQSNACDRIADLIGRILTIRVTDSAGTRQTSGWITDDPNGTRWRHEENLNFTLVIYCPDPLKYGPPIEYPASTGMITVRNHGPPPVYPILHVTGTPKTVSLTYDGHRITWTLPNTGPVDAKLDLATMIPDTGTITMDDTFQVPPGTHLIRSTTTGNANTSLIIRNAWR